MITWHPGSKSSLRVVNFSCQRIIVVIYCYTSTNTSACYAKICAIADENRAIWQDYSVWHDSTSWHCLNHPSWVSLCQIKQVGIGCCWCTCRKAVSTWTIREDDANYHAKGHWKRYRWANFIDWLEVHLLHISLHKREACQLSTYQKQRICAQSKFSHYGKSWSCSPS